MRYKIAKPALLARMSELGQNSRQQICYLRHTIAVLMEKEDFINFDALAKGTNIYYLILCASFELIRFNFEDYLIIVQVTTHEIIIETRKK